jgi:hypothetical protein
VEKYKREGGLLLRFSADVYQLSSKDFQGVGIWEMERFYFVCLFLYKKSQSVCVCVCHVITNIPFVFGRRRLPLI